MVEELVIWQTQMTPSDVMQNQHQLSLVEFPQLKGELLPVCECHIFAMTLTWKCQMAMTE